MTDEQKEIRKCMESPAYLYNKYLVLKDSDGNILPKREVTDEEISQKVSAYLLWRNSRRI